MPRKAKQSVHAALDRLRQQAAGERIKARELEAALEAAKTEVETASAAITEAYAAENQRAATAARKTEQAAAGKVKETQHRLAGAEIRVGRAQAEADTFQAEHASHSLEEREAEARELAMKLTRAGSEAVRHHRGTSPCVWRSTCWSPRCQAPRPGPMAPSRRTPGNARCATWTGRVRGTDPQKSSCSRISQRDASSRGGPRGPLRDASPLREAAA